ncbi:MAG: cytochrome c biogenesis protein [Sorangiineae bacterium]|nr:cytochrome c biogenesis protein [Polyangiaceae bacterium]MEB2322478.1 cytochrome c biogenesis protein [Sorangiineae bacterium]
MQRASLAFHAVLGAAAATIGVLIYYILYVTPEAQLATGGLAQKIFYFHVPAAYAMYLSGVVCMLASAAYLVGATDRRNAWARAGAECAVVFGLLVLVSGPLWARKAWGVYWTWDPRLTTSLLSVLVYVAVVVLRAFAGDGDAERKFAAALGVLGTVNLPIIHYSVQKWGGNHPVVITKGGGGLADPRMGTALGIGFLAFTLLAIVLLALRARLALLSARVDRAEERAAAAGITEGL